MLGVNKFLFDSRIVIVEYHLESECILLFDQTSPKSKCKFLVSKPAFFIVAKVLPFCEKRRPRNINKGFF